MSPVLDLFGHAAGGKLPETAAVSSIVIGGKPASPNALGIFAAGLRDAGEKRHIDPVNMLVEALRAGDAKGEFMRGTPGGKELKDVPADALAGTVPVVSKGDLFGPAL